MKIVLTIALGVFFGTVLIASQAFNWYRIQEMFHFQSFHMFGLLGSAIATGALSVWILKKRKTVSIHGKPIQPTKKKIRPVGNVVGGTLFGIGWGITGACTAPVFILVGWKWEIGVACLLGVLVGTVFYAAIKSKIPK